MALVNLVLPLILLEGIWVVALPEETYLQIPYTEDDEGYLYMDTRAAESDPKMSETRRRSTLNKNFARLGRGDLSPLISYDYDPDVEAYTRPTRSGDKSDHFIRFGKGNSDFVRFGRDPYKARSTRDQHFVRFGRSVPKDKARNKREADYFKRVGGNNFVRFGRGNSDFMRFGRDPESAPTSASSTTASKPEHVQQHGDGRNEYLLRLLLELLQRRHEPRQG